MSIVPRVFDCQGASLVGLLHVAGSDARRAAVIVVGGPQYRVGSHRHFYDIAGSLAATGVPVLRFDYRGMGDSGGEFRGFEALDDDIRAAVDEVVACKDGIEEVVLIGLCDAASAIMMYACQDDRVAGMVVMNPWVRSAESHARATVKHYYLRRLTSGELWRKIGRGEFEWRASLASLGGLLRRALPSSGARRAAPKNYQARMLDGFLRFAGRTLLITSGDDLTAKEFLDRVGAEPAWRAALGRECVTHESLPDANHTFSTAAWRTRVNDWIVGWIHSW